MRTARRAGIAAIRLTMNRSTPAPRSTPRLRAFLLWSGLAVLFGAMLTTPAGAARVALGPDENAIGDRGEYTLSRGFAWKRGGPRLLLEQYLSAPTGASWSDLRGFCFIELRADPRIAAPMWAELTPEESTALRDQLSAILAERETDQGAKPGIDATIYTGLYGINTFGAVQLPDDVRLRILPEYEGFDIDGNPVYDSRITLIVHDYEGRAQPFIAHMHDDVARELLAALAPTAGMPPPTDDRMPQYRIEHPVLRGDSWRRNQ